MAITIGTQTNIDKSNLAAYPNGQIKDDSGIGDGTPINCVTSSDIWEFFDKLMRLADISFNNDFDNEVNGYQYVQAAIALASKSDYVRALATSGGVLNLDTKLGILQTNEKLLALASSDYAAETDITGTDSPLVTKTIIITQQWKAGDYLLLVNTPGGIEIKQLVTGDNINLIVGANNYLKAANNLTTLAGISTAAAVTPASLLYAFQERISDPLEIESAPYEASATQPGILSIALFNQIANFTNAVKNVGWFSGVDPGAGTIGAFATRSGNILSAQITAVAPGSGGSTTYRVVVDNAMDMSAGKGYFVRMMVQSEGTLELDNDVCVPVFKVVNSTTFDFSISEANTGVASAQNLKIHCEVVQI
jgi:hypothetical protein